MIRLPLLSQEAIKVTKFISSQTINRYNENRDTSSCDTVSCDILLGAKYN